MAVKIGFSKEGTTYRMISTDTKPTTGINDGDYLEVLNTATSAVDEIWVWHVDAWFKY